jgi:hypothetical protein
MASPLEPVKLNRLLEKDDIPEAAKKWIDGLEADDIFVHVIEFEFGEEIGNFQRFSFTGTDTALELRLQSCIGILVSGEAEIYETEFLRHKKHNFLAYRPIRILRVGDIFGDFRFVDQHIVYGVAAKSQPELRTRPGEKWRFCAGRKSVFVKGRIHFKTRRSHFECDLRVDDFETIDGQPFVTREVFQAHAYVNRLNKIERQEEHFQKNSHLLTKVIFIDHEHFSPVSWLGSDEITPAIVSRNTRFLEIVKESWRRAKYYRDGINSFNYAKVIRFISDVRKIESSMRRPPQQAKGGAKSLPYPSIDQRLNRIFCEALYDAINRPIRREMLFALDERVLNSERRTHPDFVDLSKDGSDPETDDAEPVSFLFPTLSEEGEHGEFLFPLDLTNYYINAACKHHNLADAAFLGIGGNRPAEEERATKFQTKRKFFIDLANNAIQMYRAGHPDYPFDVKCVDIPGPEKDNIVLVFTPETKA